MRIPAGATAALLLVDALLIPTMVRRRRATEPPPDLAPADPAYREDAPPNPPGLPGQITAGNRHAGARVWGELVAYWSVLAVFAYYFEVIGRYVFNSPTNWVHESTLPDVRHAVHDRRSLCLSRREPMSGSI